MPPCGFVVSPYGQPVISPVALQTSYIRDNFTDLFNIPTRRWAMMEFDDNGDSQNPLFVIEDTESDANLVDAPEVQEPEPMNTTWSPSTFKKFIDYLRSKKPPRPQKYVEGWHNDPPIKPRDDDSQANDSRDHSFDHVLSPYHAIQDQQWEQLSGYSSQLGTVKTNSLSAMSQSAVRSRRTTQSTVNRSSSSELRRSTERRSTDIEGLRLVRSSSIDDDAQRRAIKRRQAIQEILTSESDYVLGLKALTGVLSLFETRPAIYHNVQKLREIHEHFLVQLQNVSPPKSATTDAELANLISGGLSKHSSLRGFRSLQNRSLRTRNFKQKFNLRVKLIAADPTEARDVARVIQTLSTSAGAYVKFCSNKDLLKKDLSFLRESIPNWALFDQGIEALSRSVTPMESRRPKENRSMTLNDLLIKPIQRVCKYHLLLKQLSDFTLSSDCPSADHDIRQALEIMKALGDKVNSATGNLAYEDRIRKTIGLQEKLGSFQSGALRDIYKQLGPMVMCGVLHVTYQSGDHIKGTYMVCILFDNYLLLAKYVEESRQLQPVACLYVWDLKIDCLRNGKGLSCYECLFSWKLVFHHQNDHYEFVLSASTAAEERQWASEIVKSTQKVEPVPEPRRFSVLTLDVEPFERSSAAIGRKSSVHSLSTSRTNNNSQHVIIERTHHPNSSEAVHPVEGEIERPRVMPPQAALTLVTRRQDRIRLEQFISDEYTRDVLPFPGMVLGYQDKRHKKMKGSVHATFTKRSVSLSKIVNTTTGTDHHRTDSLSKGTDGIVARPLHDLFPYDDEKGFVLLEAPPEANQPASTLKLGKMSRRTTSATRTASQGSKSYGVLGSPTWKSFGSLFHTISPRRHKRTGSWLSKSEA